MKDENDLQNKVMQPMPNKAVTVKIKIKENRAITGVGKAGDVIEVSELAAKNFVSLGFAEYVNPHPTLPQI
jgi:hypothetical protein